MDARLADRIAREKGLNVTCIDLDVSENRGTPKSSIFIGVFHYKPSILGYPYFWIHPFTNGQGGRLNTADPWFFD